MTKQHEYEPMDLSGFTGHTTGKWKSVYSEVYAAGSLIEIEKENDRPVTAGDADKILMAAAPDLLTKLDEAQREIARLEARNKELEALADLAARYITHLGKPRVSLGTGFLEGIKMQLALEAALIKLGKKEEG